MGPRFFRALDPMPPPKLNSGQEKTLRAVFARPTLSSIRWAAVKSLFEALGGEEVQRSGSRVAIVLPTHDGDEITGHFHEPHEKEAPKGMVDEARRLLEEAGYGI